MGLIRLMERGGEDYHDYKKALKIAKKAIDELCDITADMEDEYGYSERGGYSARDEEPSDRMQTRMRRRMR